jgi:hypothetical protein
MSIYDRMDAAIANLEDRCPHCGAWWKHNHYYPGGIEKSKGGVAGKDFWVWSPLDIEHEAKL